MSPGDLANSLRGVPPVTLEIFRLAWLVRTFPTAWPTSPTMSTANAMKQ